jgi:hypothetical protein
MKRRTILIIALANAVAAQTSSDIVPEIGQTMKQNLEVLRQYSYKRRTEIEVKGKSRGARVELVRYVDGRLETVPLETPPSQAGPGRQGGLRGRIIQNKKEAMKEDVERLTNLLHRYVSPDTNSMRMVLDKAAVSRTDPQPEASIKVVAAGLVEPSDSFTLTWSAAEHRPEKIEIRTALDGKPVNAMVDYGCLPNGPFYAARTVVSDAKDDLRITLETFDYAHGGDVR